ncbi:MAG: hypothetical protein ACK40M_10985 [Flavobacteriales bacterium]
MNLDEFRELSLSHRADLVQAEGKFIASRSAQTFHVDLYRVRNFYVEIWNNTIHGILMQIDGFEDDQFLKPYLDDINVKDLFSSH